MESVGFKVSKVFWFFSLAAVLGTFLYVYASLPESVVVRESEGVFTLSKELFFYVVLVGIALTNSSVFVVTRIYPAEASGFKAWFYGLVLFINLFFVVGLHFLNLYNSNEKFNYSQIGLIIYSSLALLIFWSISRPVYLVYARITKQSSQ